MIYIYILVLRSIIGVSGLDCNIHDLCVNKLNVCMSTHLNYTELENKAPNSALSQCRTLVDSNSVYGRCVMSEYVKGVALPYIATTIRIALILSGISLPHSEQEYFSLTLPLTSDPLAFSLHGRNLQGAASWERQVHGQTIF